MERWTFREGRSNKDRDAVESLVNWAYHDLEDFFKVTERFIDNDVDECFKSGVFILAESVETTRLDGLIYYSILQGDLSFGPFAVRPDMRRSGLGSILLQKAEEIARAHQCQRISCTVVNVREDMLAFYDRRGFTRSRTLEYTPPERVKFNVHYIELVKPL